MAVKLFEDLRVGDILFYVSPISLKIAEVTIVDLMLLNSYKPPAIKVKTIKNMESRSPLITEEALKRAEKLEGTDIFVTMILPKKESHALLLQKTPTMVFTTKEGCKRWQEKSG